MKKSDKKGLFSLIIYTFGIVLFSVLFFRIDSDYLWHIKAGEYIFKNGIVRYDIFSWVVNGKYWMSHEWLFEWFIYALKNIFGKFHLFIYCFGCSLVLALLLLFSNKKHYLKNYFFSVMWISLFVFIIFFMQVRPHLISFIFIAITMYCLTDLYNNDKSKKIYFLPFVSILWSNIHGGSSNLIYILPLIFIISGMFQFRGSKIFSTKLSFIQLKKYIIVLLLCIVGICINIHGIKMFMYPYQNMMNTTMINNILEWRSTSLNEPIHYLYYVFIIFVFSIMMVSKNKIRLLDLLIFVFCVYLGLKSIRFWFYSYIMMSYVIFNYVNNRGSDNGFRLGIFIYSILFLILFIMRFYTVFNNKYEVLLTEKDISFLKKQNPKRLFNMYNYGGDLIYNGLLVFVDGRADLYSEHNIYKDYLSLSNLNGDVSLIFNKYNFDYFLVDSNYPINNYLLMNDKYRLIYSRDDIRIYKILNK